jgi:uncharacterized protein YjgD (DUF1641 family)
MFNADDFDKLEESMDTMPDGLLDASDYYEDMEKVTDILSGIQYDDMVSRMHGMMNIMNIIYGEDGGLSIERVNGVVIALSFHAVNILNSLEDESRDEYFNFTKNDVLKEIKDEVSSLPYWDLDETNGE